MNRIQSRNRNHNLIERGNKIWFKFVYRGQQIFTTTGLVPSSANGWKEARKLRDHWIAGIRREGLSFVDVQKKGNAPEQKPPSIAEVLSIYDTVKDIKLETKKNNKRSLKAILRFSDVDFSADASVLNRAVCFYRDNKNTRPNSINAELRFAKSIFAPRYRELYKSSGLTLPDLDPFLKLSFVRSNKPEGLPHLEVMQEIDKHEQELSGDLLKAWILVRYAGMRNSEIYGLKTSAFQSNGQTFWIEPNHTKTDDSRQIPIREEHMQFLLNGANRTVLEGPYTTRYNVVNRELSKWLRQFIPPEYNKTVYAVRKYCESLMVEKYGSFKASKILGHSTEISYTYYARVLTLPEPI